MMDKRKEEIVLELIKICRVVGHEKTCNRWDVGPEATQRGSCDCSYLALRDTLLAYDNAGGRKLNRRKIKNF